MAEKAEIVEAIKMALEDIFNDSTDKVVERVSAIEKDIATMKERQQNNAKLISDAKREHIDMNENIDSLKKSMSKVDSAINVMVANCSCASKDEREQHLSEHEYVRDLRKKFNAVGDRTLNVLVGAIVVALLTLIVMGFISWNGKQKASSMMDVQHSSPATHDGLPEHKHDEHNNMIFTPKR